MEHKIKVGMILLMVSDIEKAVEFYKNLGLILKFHLKEQWAEFEDTRGLKIGLYPTTEEPFERHTGIVLEVEDIRKTQEYFGRHGIEFLKDPEVAIHGIMANVKDPSGNVLDIYQPTPEKVKELAKQAALEKDCQKDCKDDCKDDSCSENADETPCC